MSEWQINGEAFSKGQQCSLDVPWPNGRTKNMTGVLISVVGSDAYVETPVGCVAGLANTLAHA